MIYIYIYLNRIREHLAVSVCILERREFCVHACYKKNVPQGFIQTSRRLCIALYEIENGF